MGQKFSAEKLRVSLKLAEKRAQMHIQKQGNLIKLAKKEISKLLAAQKDEAARIKMEGVIHQHNLTLALETIGLMSELICGRRALLGSEPDPQTGRPVCPEQLEESVATLIYACTRVEIPELLQARQEFGLLFGVEFVQRHANNASGKVNPRIVELLGISPPAFQKTLDWLRETADAYQVDWVPSKDLTDPQAFGAVVPLPQERMSNEFKLRFMEKHGRAPRPDEELEALREQQQQQQPVAGNEQLELDFQRLEEQADADERKNAAPEAMQPPAAGPLQTIGGGEPPFGEGDRLPADQSQQQLLHAQEERMRSLELQILYMQQQQQLSQQEKLLLEQRLFELHMMMQQGQQQQQQQQQQGQAASPRTQPVSPQSLPQQQQQQQQQQQKSATNMPPPPYSSEAGPGAADLEDGESEADTEPGAAPLSSQPPSAAAGSAAGGDDPLDTGDDGSGWWKGLDRLQDPPPRPVEELRRQASADGPEAAEPQLQQVEQEPAVDLPDFDELERRFNALK